MPAQYSLVSHLDCDAQFDECTVDSEKSRLLAQRSELPTLEWKISIGFLHQHKRLEGVHFEGNLGFFFIIIDISDTIFLPPFPWVKNILITFQFCNIEGVYLVPLNIGKVLSDLPAASQRATWGVSKKMTKSGSVTDIPTGGLVSPSLSSE